jgi:hypothetical protein
MLKQRYQVLSPDGITIEPCWSYPSLKKAKDALKKWMKGFERQGFYSSNYGRINLEFLEEACEINPI